MIDYLDLHYLFQAITYLTLLKHLEDDSGPHLIVCPASVLENWERELKKWCPSFNVLQYHGAARSAYSKELSYVSKSGLPPPFNVILVCYSIFERRRLATPDILDNPMLWLAHTYSYLVANEQCSAER